ncbi:hypothetical protein LPC08_16685 [Roseomonas sp. OT10]|uniref:hypothetical protein n=1 Tax=Roseomonas cutis TaxID=2897332 RepID=UPI001E463DA3|nr:hypothetical protein [Roseomonas sp. OT10]UFN47640.1 hypothetical protein LPC08_16685 [Roseomonas sp. OT10]
MNVPYRSFIFAPLNNTQKKGMDPNDAVGAFHPGMRMYKSYYEGLGGTVVDHYFNNERGLGFGKVSRGIIDAMIRGSGGHYYEAIVYFGHGTETHMSSVGWDKKTVKDLTDAIDTYGSADVKVILYACSCGADGGIAYTMADNLKAWANTGMEVYGHATPGHSYTNAPVRRFPNANGLVGYQVCPPGKGPAWTKALRNEKSMFWARFPFMTPEEIEAELG